MNRIDLVYGYHEFVPPPAAAIEHFLDIRTAVVLSPQNGFPSCLYLALAQWIAGAAPHDRVAVLYDDAATFEGLQPLASHLALLHDDDRDAPRQIQFWLSGSIIALLDTEFWVYAGGPEPYHDSYTVSIYTRRPLPGIADACRNLAAKFQFTMGHTLWAAPHPP